MSDNPIVRSARKASRRRSLRVLTLTLCLVLAGLVSGVPAWSGTHERTETASAVHRGDTQAWEAAVAAYLQGNHRAAAHWFRQDAEAGHGRAQAMLGAMYAEGQGVAQSYREAAHWYRLGAEQDEPLAQVRLAELHEFGRGVSQDAGLAERLYIAAAEAGEKKAQARLGLLYYDGSGILARDDRAALRWLRAAALQNDARSQAFLGIMHAEGRGMTADPVMAQVWLEIAAAQGDPLGRTVAPRNAENLSIAQVASAMAQAKAWREAYEARQGE